MTSEGALARGEGMWLAMLGAAVAVTDCFAAARLFGPLAGVGAGGWGGLLAVLALAAVCVAGELLATRCALHAVPGGRAPRGHAVRALAGLTAAGVAGGVLLSRAGELLATRCAYGLIGAATLGYALLVADLAEGRLACARLGGGRHGQPRLACALGGYAAGLLVGTLIVRGVEGSREALLLAEAALAGAAVLAFAMLARAAGSTNGTGSFVLAGDDPAAGLARMCDAGGLTRREADVLALLARGYSLPVVADRLSMARGTADTHAKSIYRKLGVHSREELLDACAAAAREVSPAPSR